MVAIFLENSLRPSLHLHLSLHKESFFEVRAELSSHHKSFLFVECDIASWNRDAVFEEELNDLVLVKHEVAGWKWNQYNRILSKS